MSEIEEKKVEAILSDLDLRFRSGNSIPVEQAQIKAADYATLKSFVVAELRRRQSARAWSDIADRQM